MDTYEPATYEADSRFPSGEWTGFFLQPVLPGKHTMELFLSFRDAVIKGEGRDRVGRFTIKGRYQLEDGRCWWTKTYIDKHSVEYTGYNEGKGIWGMWNMGRNWSGGFHVWPIAMGDPTIERLAVEADVTGVVEIPIVEQVAEPVGAVSRALRGKPSEL
jgi:hypothetical protein